MALEKQTLISYRTERSEEALEEAKLALDNNKLNLAANRIYYAGFYIVSALALKEDFSTSKHAQLLGWFNKNYVKTGKVTQEFGQTYQMSFRERQEADYEDLVSFEKDDLTDKLEQMKLFVGKIKELL